MRCEASRDPEALGARQQLIEPAHQGGCDTRTELSFHDHRRNGDVSDLVFGKWREGAKLFWKRTHVVAHLLLALLGQSTEGLGTERTFGEAHEPLLGFAAIELLLRSKEK